MKAYEVWEMWKEDESLLFEDSDERYIYYQDGEVRVRGLEPGILPIKDFLETDWLSLKRWRQEGISGAVYAFISEEKIPIREIDMHGRVRIYDPKQGHHFLMGPNSVFSQWFVLEEQN